MVCRPRCNTLSESRLQSPGLFHPLTNQRPDDEDQYSRQQGTDDGKTKPSAIHYLGRHARPPAGGANQPRGCDVHPYQLPRHHLAKDQRGSRDRENVQSFHAATFSHQLIPAGHSAAKLWPVRSSNTIQAIPADHRSSSGQGRVPQPTTTIAPAATQTLPIKDV